MLDKTEKDNTTFDNVYETIHRQMRERTLHGLSTKVFDNQ